MANLPKNSYLSSQKLGWRLVLEQWGGRVKTSCVKVLSCAGYFSSRNFSSRHSHAATFSARSTQAKGAEYKQRDSFGAAGGLSPRPQASRVVNQPATRPDFSAIAVALARAIWRKIWRRGVLLGIVGLMPILATIAGGVAWVDRHPVREAIFESRFVHLDPAMLQPKIQHLLVGSLLEIDLAAIKASLQEVPWVERVSIRRLWPDRLKIHLTEKKVLARWRDDGFVSDQGVIFQAPMTEAAQAFFSVLPVLSGPESDASVLLDYYEKMSATLGPSELQITALSQVDHGWQLKLDNQISVFLSEDQAVDQLARFRQVYDQLGARRSEVASADLRYHHGVAIRWKDTSS